MSVLRKKDKGGGMMERLTREMTFEEEYIILQKEVKELFDKEDRESEPPENNCVVRRALRCIKKLVSEVEQYKAYNDLEEQGLLLRLPCKIGTKVYNITWWDDVQEKVVVKGKTYYRTIHKHKVSKSTFGYTDIEEIGKTVFLTKSEAEAKLKELRG